ncbi:MAG TPA: amidase, partial [Candidatus Wallbacteria bacterium]|nr:amidase [Candidatus Wallbacteria bacterium]
RFDGVKYGFRAAEFKNLKDMYMKTRDEGFGAEVKRRIILGTYALSSGYYDAYYKTAQKARTKIKEDFQDAFSRADLILSPVTPAAAFKIGEKTADPLTMYMSDIFTISANLASIPALSIPCGLSGGMPVGLQLSGNYFQEGKMLAAAYEFQKRTDHHLCVAAV